MASDLRMRTLANFFARECQLDDPCQLASTTGLRLPVREPHGRPQALLVLLDYFFVTIFPTNTNIQEQQITLRPH